MGGLLGQRRVLLFSAAIFTLCCVLLPFSPSLRVMLCLQMVSGLSSDTFYPLSAGNELRATRAAVPLRNIT
ncbi:MAG TPA: hypothetical protein VLJ61_00340 [Pyrinomonadaceae bacterium]|nr:hypothetical protein [Pyrinomonadaceae bacterium]